MKSKTEIPKALQNIDLKAVLRKHGAYLQLRRNKEMKEAAMPLARQMLKSKKAAPEVPKYSNFSNDEAETYRLKQVRIVQVVEEKFQKKLEQYISKMLQGYLAHIDAEIQKGVKSKKVKAKGYFDDEYDELLKVAQLDFTPLLESVATLAGQEAFDLLKNNDVYIPHNFRKQISDNVEKMASSLIDTDREKLTRILDEGISSGSSMAEIRDQISNSFDSAYTKMQAERTTVTEVSRTSIQAQVDAYKQSGVVEGLQWVIDGATDECADYDGDVIAPDGNFYDIKSEFQDGYPPLHPNCKCGVIPVLIDNKENIYVPVKNEKLYARVKELEDQIDKRTKEFKELKAKYVEETADSKAYIKALENYLDEPPRES